MIYTLHYPCTSSNETLLYCTYIYLSIKSLITVLIFVTSKVTTISAMALTCISGLWWGYVIGLGVQDLCLMLFVAKLDWDAESNKVSLSYEAIH